MAKAQPHRRADDWPRSAARRPVGARASARRQINRWIFESREAWEKLWGSPEAPRPPAEYPKGWMVWENEILAPFLTGDPDTIRFTSYEEL